MEDVIEKQCVLCISMVWLFILFGPTKTTIMINNTLLVFSFVSSFTIKGLHIDLMVFKSVVDIITSFNFFCSLKQYRFKKINKFDYLLKIDLDNLVLIIHSFLRLIKGFYGFKL